MTTETKKIEQSNYYNVVDSMGRPTSIYYCASNIKDAFKMFKADTANFQKHYYGKLKRGYNGGVRG
jgi:hypothetical protein